MFKRQYLLAVEADRDHLKIAQAQSSSNGIQITRVITESVTGLSDNEIGQQLQRILKINDFRPDQMTGIISKEKVMLRGIRLPSTKPDELEDMITFEASKQIPYSMDEVVYDYKILGVDREGYSRIILAIAHNDEVLAINRIFAASGKIPDRIVLSSEAIWSWAKYSADRPQANTNICVVTLDTHKTEITVLADNDLGFSRIVSIGALEISGKEKDKDIASASLLDEIRRSVKLAATDDKEISDRGSDISEYIITGANMAVDGFCDHIQEHLPVQCTAVNQMINLPVADDAISEKGISPEASVSKVCGALLLTEGLNLIQPHIRKRQEAAVQSRRIITVSVCVLAAVMFLSIAGLVRLYQKERLFARLKHMYEKTGPIADLTQTRQKRLALIKEQFSEGSTSLDALYHIYKLMPGSASLVDFDYDDNTKSVRLRGTSLQMADVFRLTTVLQESGRFSNVQASSVSKRRIADSEVVDFQIRCNFISREEAR